MDISFYQMGDLYKKNVLLKEYMDIPVNDNKNSYDLTHSMMGPGHGPSNATDTSPNQFNNSLMFPNADELSNSEKAGLLIDFCRHEIDDGNWDNKTEELFGKLLDHLIGLEPSEDKPE
jgi:hypothetical protein